MRGQGEVIGLVGRQSSPNPHHLGDLIHGLLYHLGACRLCHQQEFFLLGIEFLVGGVRQKNEVVLAVSQNRRSLLHDSDHAESLGGEVPACQADLLAYWVLVGEERIRHVLPQNRHHGPVVHVAVGEESSLCGEVVVDRLI